ncbi:family 32 glycoside hydrolase [Phakopsora pachyrhizi]|nr:family 32 glycoside hydrolase [Phakopsora pachyrhizi]
MLRETCFRILLDQEETFRTESDLSHHDPQIPFLLNRFGYDRQSVRLDNLKFDPRQSRIPSILHLVPPGRDVFSYIQFLSISSAISQIKPNLTIAHMIRGSIPEPGKNFWFDEFLRLNTTGSLISLVEVEDPREVFGNPIIDVSHKSDVIRLRALKSYGGIYVDTDVIVLRSFEELMGGREEIVLGIEKADGTLNEPVLINGICNAVMISKKDSSFLEKWWQSYKTFDGKPFRAGGVWNYHSVILPWQFVKEATTGKTPVTILDHRSFFTPLWDDPGLKWIHGTLKRTSEEVPKRPSLEDLESTGQLGYHMWHHLLEERISIATDGEIGSVELLDPIDCYTRDSSFNRVVRRYLGKELVLRWVEWKLKPNGQF